MGRGVSLRGRLARYLAGWHDVRLQPGARDCAHLAAGWVAELRGTDPAAGFTGRYRTLEGGLEALRQAGFADLRALARHHLDPVPQRHQARDGDIAVVPVPDGVGQAFGIVASARIHVLAPGGGIDLLPLDSALEVFRP